MIKKIYNESIESLCTRILYFFNSLDTYYLVAGLASLFIYAKFNVSIQNLLLTLLITFIIIKMSDFHPIFIALSSIILSLILFTNQQLLLPLLNLVFINILIFIIIQSTLMAIPNAIIARDPRVPFFVFFNSLFTIAPTTTSFLMSVSFSSLLAFLLYSGSSREIPQGIFNLPFWLSFVALAMISRCFRPKSIVSKFGKLPLKKEYFRRIIVFNIDGCRLDLFKKLDLQNIRNLEKEGSSFPEGLTTIYRALTNPAFASMLTGTTPKYHKVINNNLGQSIKTQGLPDIVPTILYGSMHIKHFSKKDWRTKIVSLPVHSIYKSDEIMMDWLKDDLDNDKKTRLFIADFSEADFLGHAYGSTSKYYQEALKNIDQKIGKFLIWFKDKEIAKDSAIIVCSDHGIYNIDHSYLFFTAEKYVPFIAVGNGIKENQKIKKPATIMDIGITISYLLGCPYPLSSKGQVLAEILEDVDTSQEKDAIIGKINRIFYDTIPQDYAPVCPEVYSGDIKWWQDTLKEVYQRIGRPLNVLDFGCGSGFVGSVFKNNKIPINKFVCYDISAKLLKEAKNILGEDKFYFAEDWNKIAQDKNNYDIITINSVLHHLYAPKNYTDILNSLLKPGGFIIGAHEPNQEFFKSRFIRLLAGLFKLIGRKKISPDHLDLINAQIKKEMPFIAALSEEEILQIVDYHSPIEQRLFGIDKDTGFTELDLKNKFFPDFKILKLERYSTFMHRNWIINNPLFFVLFSFVYNTFFKSGNLFRYVVQKPA